MQSGDGVFTRQFREWAEAKGVEIGIRLECDSFPQAFRALSSGKFATVLPTIASGELPDEALWKILLPFLNKKPRQICLT